MDVSHILDGLNNAQREAVTAPPGPMLTLAGAGSGKTRVLVHRMSWLIQVEGVSPFSVMAVTFTNKAAREMRGRVEELQGSAINGMWLGTFHGLSHRFLRSHWKEAELPQAFQILDSDDQYRMIRRVLRSLELDEAQWVPRQIQAFINNRKDEGQRPQHIHSGNDPISTQLVRIYSAYEASCKRAGAVDFAELLLRALETLRDSPTLLQHYRQRFTHVLVDEFQDTNSIQYAWVRLLAGDATQQGAHLFVVGDDDQSIYGWRGAKVENILTFQKDFPNTQLVRLEQNYRSTATILNAANALIANNTQRMGKQLWTDGDEGEPIDLYQAFNEQDEARYVMDGIENWIEQGHARAEIAILYRSNAQSRVFEEQLIGRGIPYRVYGGLRFFERAEIKDALAYLRLLNNKHDDTSFERVINQPTRGMGTKSVDAIRETARIMDASLWQAAQARIESNEMTARAQNALQGFIELIKQLRDATKDLPLHEQVEHVIHQSGLIDHYGKEKSEKAEARVENLEELVSAAKGFDFNNDDDLEMDNLTAFLSHAALEAGEGQADSWEDCVQLMTLHTAKGLEFPLVFMAGMEDGLFPHQRSIDDSSKLQEERRLAYVGITRAREKLVITYAERRRLYGKDHYAMRSQFIGEIPKEYLREVRAKTQVSAPIYQTTKLHEESEAGFNIGQAVFHQKFGEGMVLNYEGQGRHARVEVNFKHAGSKWLVLSYANLQII